METAARFELALTELQSVAWPLGHAVFGVSEGFRTPDLKGHNLPL